MHFCKNLTSLTTDFQVGTDLVTLTECLFEKLCVRPHLIDTRLAGNHRKTL